MGVGEDQFSICVVCVNSWGGDTQAWLNVVKKVPARSDVLMTYDQVNISNA